MSLDAGDAKTLLAAMLTNARADLAAIDEIERLIGSRAESWDAAKTPEIANLWSKFLVGHLAPLRDVLTAYAERWARDLAELDAGTER